MSLTVNHTTACHYLFNKSAEEIFPPHPYSSEFINKSLEMMMRINRLMFSKEEAHFLLDPTAFNNQCHLYALIAAQKIQELRVVASFSMPIKACRLIEDYCFDQRFLHLAMLLSYAFLTDLNLLEKLVEKSVPELEEPLEIPKKVFIKFLKDPITVKAITRTGRLALNVLFKEHLISTFNARQEPLYQELSRLAQENLLLPPLQAILKKHSTHSLNWQESHIC